MEADQNQKFLRESFSLNGKTLLQMCCYLKPWKKVSKSTLKPTRSYTKTNKNKAFEIQKMNRF